MEKIIIPKENIKTLMESRFIKVYDLQYAPGAHYYDASRRSLDDLVAHKSDSDFQTMLPDAVSCFVILKIADQEARLLTSFEYRYPAGQFLLSPPAGLIDPEDAVIAAASADRDSAVPTGASAERDSAVPSGASAERGPAVPTGASADRNSAVPTGASADRNSAVPTDVSASAILSAAAREIREETGLEVKETDRLFVVNPLLFSSPGMTDESNALACAVISVEDLSALTQEGAEGSEKFDGFKLISREEALEILRQGRDENGNFFSVYTWCALMYFVSGMWE